MSDEKPPMTPEGGILLTYGPTLFVPKRNKFDPAKPARYEAHVIIDKAGQATADFKRIKQLMYAAGVEKFGEAKMKDKAFIAKLKMPIKPYDKGADGEVTISAWSQDPVEIVDGQLKNITVQADVWSGQLARLIVNAKAYGDGNNCIVLYLNAVQITKRNMPALAGARVSAKQAFSVVEDEGGEGALGGAEDDDLPF